ncbi:uncharacterized protein K444DRAFT_414454 [Hyaloscypha bicolor E]|uniref:Uncharacterized protein n=1 Tax=Hyaloscypha bicolor E TaxID=1095630 RepID=A0A2J6T6M2_9HELO|nr:uncharacterized protein K444DRAFT_414454 [Hyaloscypha bicolor E]PMD58666.1 hypothetical protein K444DRAFT_414454 [Hyaloscypha bicolor E]
MTRWNETELLEASKRKTRLFGMNGIMVVWWMHYLQLRPGWPIVVKDIHPALLQSTVDDPTTKMVGQCFPLNHLLTFGNHFATSTDQVGFALCLATRSCRPPNRTPRQAPVADHYEHQTSERSPLFSSMLFEHYLCRGSIRLFYVRSYSY